MIRVDTTENGIRTSKNDEKLWNSFQDKLMKLKDSDLVKSIIKLFHSLEISHIRCLGLGSVSDSSLAMYQLCLLNIIQLYFNKDDKKINFKITFWDPAFTEQDKLFLTDKFDYEIIKDLESDTSSTLFYLPHFPIAELETFISEIKPLFVLSNDLTIYTTKFTDAKYFELYPNCSRLAKLIQDSNDDSSKTIPKEIENEFQIVTKKKNRKNRKRENNAIFTPSTVNYDFDSAYFSSVQTSILKEGNDLSNAWTSAFTDLSFMKILKK
jgi:hypothetical protein